jgi:hypothetical protein
MVLTVAVAVVVVVTLVVTLVVVVVVVAMVVLMPMLVTAARAAHAARPVCAAHSPFLITRAQALRNAEPRHVALVHSRFLPKVTQSLNSL